MLPFALALAALVALVVALRLRPHGGNPARLAEHYPAVEPAPGTHFRLDRAIFSRGYTSMAWVRIGVDRERLHVQVTGSLRGGGSFSVPLDDVTATPDRYPWMILASDTVRLQFTRAPEELMMVFPGDFEKLAQASGGRLRRAAAPALESTATAPPARSR